MTPGERNNLRGRLGEILKFLRLSTIALSACLVVFGQENFLFAAPTTSLVEDAFHEAAQRFLQQEDTAALEKINVALNMDPSHEPSKKLKQIIEAALENSNSQETDETQQQESSSRDGSNETNDNEPVDENTSENTSDDPDNGEDDAQAENSSSQPEQSEKGGQQETEPSSTEEESQAASDSQPASDPTRPDGGDDEKQGNVGSASGSDQMSEEAEDSNQNSMSPEQVETFLNALTDDELTQLRARPVRVYGEQQSDEDW